MGVGIEDVETVQGHRGAIAQSDIALLGLEFVRPAGGKLGGVTRAGKAPRDREADVGRTTENENRPFTHMPNLSDCADTN
jgi:hypothetical protein